jgi:hypothetical protein
LKGVLRSYNKAMNNYIIIAIVLLSLWMFIGFSGAVKTFKKTFDTDMPMETSNSTLLREDTSEKIKDLNEKNRRMIDDLNDKMRQKF